MKLLKWKVCDVPTGRFASFQQRSWPDACFARSAKAAASISCGAEEYVPSRVKTGEHGELTVSIAEYHHDEATRKLKGSFTWRRLKQRCKTLDEAKDLAERALKAHPHFWPAEEPKQ